MDINEFLPKETADKITQYASAMKATPEEVFGVLAGVMQYFIRNSTIKGGGRELKNDMNYVVVDCSGNAGKCARRLQEIRSRLLDPQEATRLAEQDSKRVECDRVTGKQKVHLDEHTVNGLFIIKPETVREELRNKSTYDYNYTFIGNMPGEVKVPPPKSKEQNEEDAKVIQEMEDRIAAMFRMLMGVGQTQFRLSPDAEEYLKQICSEEISSEEEEFHLGNLML